MSNSNLRSKVVVFYLARMSEGLREVSTFIDSYKKHISGKTHTLVIICKGDDEYEDRFRIDQLLSGVTHEVIWIPDSTGFDLHAYRFAAKLYENSHFYSVFLKTSSKIKSDNWLLILYQGIIKNNVGLVGTTGSYESLYSSWKIITASQTSFREGNLTLKDLNTWKWILKGDSNQIKYLFKYFVYRLKSLLRRIIRFIAGIQNSKINISRDWNSASGIGGGLDFVNNFPKYPNPHIRTTGYIIETKIFLSLQIDKKIDRISAALFESGPNSLTRQIKEHGLEVLVANTASQYFQMKDWEKSETFRVKDQGKLLISDNRTDDYLAMHKSTKSLHNKITWGTENPILGVNFSDKFFVYEKQDINSYFKFSIVIPTHNGNKLIKDCVINTLEQSYENFEVIVFDNCSETPISTELKDIVNSKLSVYRSDLFLSVTQSWNSAMDFATGEYVILLGDDDGLSPNALEYLNSTIIEFDHPSLLFSNLFQFLHPGVLSNDSLGVLRVHPTGNFLENHETPFYLSDKERYKQILGSLALRRNFLFNMPSLTMKRDLINKVKEDKGFFRPPFPDYYIANVLFKLADSVVAIPKPIAFQGVSKKSFGHSLFTGTTDEGFKRLGDDSELSTIYEKYSDCILPGSGYREKYMITMIQVLEKLNMETSLLDWTRYRKIMIFDLLSKILHEQAKFGYRKVIQEIYKEKVFFQRISMFEKIFFMKLLFIYYMAAKSHGKLIWLRSELIHEFQTMEFEPKLISIPATAIDNNRDLYKFLTKIC